MLEDSFKKSGNGNVFSRSEAISLLRIDNKSEDFYKLILKQMN